MSASKTTALKIIATSLVGFFSISTGAILCGSNFEETKAEDYSATITQETLGRHFGESLTVNLTIVSSNDLTIKTSGVNTISSATATNYYGYMMFTKNAGFIYSDNVISGYYPSNITATYSKGTGVTGKTLIQFGSSKMNSRTTTCTSEVTKSGIYSLDNNDKTSTYWNISSSGANVQFANIVVTYSPTGTTPPPATHTVGDINGPDSVEVGSTIALSTSCSQSDAITWSSNNTDVAAVNSSGVVTGVSAGTATITATCAGGDSKTKEITVTGGQVVPPGPDNDYYASITQEQINAGGTTLLNALRTLNSTKQTSQVGYDDMGTNVRSSMYIYTDFDYDTSRVNSDGIRVGSKIVSFYTGEVMPETENFSREHVWPASRLTGGRDHNVVDDDILMTRPASMTANGNRSNYYYSATGAPKTSDPGMYHESYRGDAARIIFYTALLDTGVSFNNNPETDQTQLTMGNLSEMLEWNYTYPVIYRETMRCDGAQFLQGNRNPFVDHPEWIPLIWGDSSDVAAYNSFKGINLDLEETTVEANSVRTLFATASDGSTISWTSNNTDVATVDSTGKVTTYNTAGAALITASATIDGVTYRKSCVVKVQAPAAESSFTLVTSTSSLVSGSAVIIAAADADKAISTTQNNNNRAAADITKSGNKATWTGDVAVLTLGGSSGQWTLYDSINEGYLYFPSGGNYLRTTSSVTDAAKWNITIDSGTTYITNVDSTDRKLKYNLVNTTFACYKTTQTEICIYTSSTPIIDVSPKTIYGDASNTPVSVTTSVQNFGGTPTITWTSANTSIARVSNSTGATNNVTLVSRGNTTITVTATLGTKTATTTIGVSVIAMEAEVTPLSSAQEWASMFLSVVLCDSSGGSAPTYANSSWNALASSYSALSADSKVYFTSATYSLNGSAVTPTGGTDSTIANCVAKYDLIVVKYSQNNFMGRTISYNSPRAVKASDDMVALVISATLLSISVLFAGYSFLRKKHD